MSLRIAGFNRTSLLDWDGCVAAVIYLQGCNFRCGYCHNPPLLPLEPELDEMPLQEVLEYLSEHRDFIDGVVVTGGEPTIHADLHMLLRQLRAIGMKTKVDTNGSNPSMLEDLICGGLVDFIAMDVKAPLDERYSRVAGVGVDLGKIAGSISLLKKGEVDYEFRTTVVPFFIQEKEVEEIAAAIAGSRRFVLHQFRPERCLDPRLAELDPYAEERVHAMAEIARRCVPRVVVRGVN
jgi:pyruvate formate lyase activating enzyme